MKIKIFNSSFCKLKQNFKKMKKAQIGETITWVIATIVIIVILTLSIFVVSSNPFKKFKKFELNKETDLLATKSFVGYLLTEQEGKKVFGQIKEKQDLDDFNGPLALKIFKNFYEEDYPIVWFGINFEGAGVRKNDYFNLRPHSRRGGDIFGKNIDYVSEKIQLNEDKYLELVLMEE